MRKRDRLLAKLLPPKPIGNDTASGSSGSFPIQGAVSANTALSTHSDTPKASRAASPVGGQPPRPLSTQSQDFLKKALALLDEQNRRIIQAYIPKSTTDIEPALRYVLDAAKQQKTLCESKRWRIRFGDSDITLRDEADEMFRRLDKIKQFGDIVVNVDPLHAGLPWAGIRLLLEV